ncbi:hypothetical protein ACFO3U_04500 [Flavobacterium ponti]|uniref:Lipoprotein n=1 Tax=Flavobacterium ponti TaxID=665133 RepID=A0ABV9P4C4_9FLAO
MIKRISLFILITSFIILLCSCRTYLDDERYLPISNDTFKIYGFKDYNELYYHSKIGASADKVFFYPQHFKINLPKKIKKWSASNNANHIEYDKNRLIIIDADYINNEIQITPWEIIDDKTKILNYMDYYYKVKKKHFNYDKSINLKNVKLYTDGKTYILFYKMENSEVFNFKKILNSFHYVD